MVQEEKQLLLKDLCARLPYGVFIHYHWSSEVYEGNTIDEDRELDFSDVETLKYTIENPQNDCCEIYWKHYLRPMSSMTEEEFKKWRKLVDLRREPTKDIFDTAILSLKNIDEVTDWLNAHHFDYRGLIPMGLALEAKEGTYKIE